MPPADSPSTRYTSQRSGSFSWQSASLPGRPPESSAPLRRVRSRALRAASRARAASIALPTIFFITAGFLSKNSPSLSLTNCVDVSADVAVQLAFGLAFELRLRQLHADHRRQTFAHVVAREIFLHVFEQTRRLARRR